MNKYRGQQLIRAGFIGTVLIVLIIAVGLQPQQLQSWATTVRYQAVFTEAGGLEPGNPVKVSGVKVGTVNDVSLDHGDALVTFTVHSKVRLGSQTTAHIRTGTLLGQRMLTLESAGSSSMRPLARIPVGRTSSPYSLTDAVSDLTTNVANTDTQSLNHALDVLSTTMDQIAPQLGPTFNGLTRLSRSLNSRNETVNELLKHTADVTAILAQRSQQVNALILDGNELTGVLVRRRQAIVRLLADTSALAQHVSGLIAENEKKLAPTLEKLNAVIKVLEKNRDNLAKAIPGLAKFESGLSEIVANGPYYVGYIPNITQGVALQPFLDYLFGFRTFDTAPGRGPGLPSPMPRALFPWPYNGIPGGSR
ncbi:MCE family protein [Mycobacterium kyorinense]|uniref:Mammalian cell entry protein n=1 Tax=Mycobacterium kyorinense TaxID=487514 RepID=A0A1X1XQT0_9MYCO|nr:MCE family protein [Mycobacterium kyorinense]ORW01207.1 mammalian cell entry protein [Mycobacterium kyorinense]